jgi:ribosomal protein L24
MNPHPFSEGDDVVFTEGKYKGTLGTVIGVWSNGLCVVEVWDAYDEITWVRPEQLDRSENQDSYQRVAD